ncbi:hypothetical protein [Bradyrhizobium sp. TM233]
MSVELIWEGRTRDVIFATLGVSVSTVKSHLIHDRLRGHLEGRGARSAG